MSGNRQREDPRIQRTREMLLRALIELGKKKPVTRIGVKELTECAGVTRSTFYLHYYDLPDFLEKTCDEVLGRFKERAQQFDTLPYEEAIEKRGTEFFRYIAENADFYRVMLGENGLPSFRRKIQAMGVEYFESRYLPPHLERVRKDTAADRIDFGVLGQYVASAKVGLVEHWIESDMRISPETLAKATSRYVQTLLAAELGIESKA